MRGFRAFSRATRHSQKFAFRARMAAPLSVATSTLSRSSCSLTMSLVDADASLMLVGEEDDDGGS
ncbi:MAG: hypothetical protein MHM6MM_003218 [Cercozoa sp. M6MM]